MDTINQSVYHKSKINWFNSFHSLPTCGKADAAKASKMLKIRNLFYIKNG
jgi:hypothetical protein